MSLRQKEFVTGKWFPVLMGMLTAFDPLTIDMYLPAFGDIQKTFQTSMSNVELSVSTFFIGMALGQLVYGPLADRFGRKKPLIAGMLLYLLATLGCAFSTNIQMFIFFRILQALGGCAGMVITRAIVRDIFDKQKIAEFLSNMALIMGLAPILAPTIGSWINGFFGWRAIFFFLAGANFFCMLTILTFLPESNHKRLSSLKISAIFHSYLQLLKNKNFTGYLIPDTAMRAGMFAYITGSPFVFIELMHIPSKYYGLIFGINGVGLLLASQINRRLLKKWQPDQILYWSVRTAALASVIVFLLSLTNSPNILLLVSLFVFLGTLNFIGPNSLASALSSQGHQAGTASALYGCLQWSLASVSSFFVSYFHNDSALPMTGVILFCGIISFFSFKILIRPVEAI